MDNSAYVPNHLPPPSLVVFSQAGGLPEALRMQRPFNPQVSVLLSLPYIRLSLCLLLHLSVSRNLAKIIKLHPSRLLFHLPSRFFEIKISCSNISECYFRQCLDKKRASFVITKRHRCLELTFIRRIRET